MNPVMLDALGVGVSPHDTLLYIPEKGKPVVVLPSLIQCYGGKFRITGDVCLGQRRSVDIEGKIDVPNPHIYVLKANRP
jgi:hypothetical protein